MFASAVAKPKNGIAGSSRMLSEMHRAISSLQRRGDTRSVAGGRGLGISPALIDIARRSIVGRLELGAVDDASEREADGFAERMMQDSGAGIATAGYRDDPNAVALQRARMGGARLSTVAGPAPAVVHQALQSPAQPLDRATRDVFESRFGHDFSGVRVHTGPAAEQSTRAVGAQAYTVGQDLVFGAGRFAPRTSEGRRLIAHELVHVVQQSGGSAPQLVRRRPNYEAGGCATCQSASAAGSRAHAEVQGLFIDVYGSGIVSEAPVYNPNDENGRLDLFRIDRSKVGQIVVEFGEIKPDNDQGREQGAADLDWYEDQLNRIFRVPTWLVSRLDVPAPSASRRFKDNARRACPWQELSVRNTKAVGHVPGLFLYKCDPPGRVPASGLAPCCEQNDDEREEPQPPTVFDRLDRPTEESESRSEEKAEPRSEDAGKDTGPEPAPRPVRPPAGDQPSLRLPPGIDWAKVAGVLAGIAALLALTPWGRIGAWIGTALGTLLRWFGFALGVAGGGAIASADELEPVSPRTRKLPPSVRTTPPAGRGSVAGGSGARATRKKPSAAGGSLAPAMGKTRAKRARGGGAAKHQRMKLIEGLNLETVRVGGVYEVTNLVTHEHLLLQATSKVTKGSDTTVEFTSLLECSADGERCDSGGNVYTVTHPYRVEDRDAPAAMAREI